MKIQSPLQRKRSETVQRDHASSDHQTPQKDSESAEDEFDQADNVQTDLWAEQLALRKM